MGEVPRGSLSTGADDDESLDDRVKSRRDIAAQCIYGVDRDPLALEMAKLSLWLVTLARTQPFAFVDHALKCGDSLLGVSSLDQLRRMNLGSERHSQLSFGGTQVTNWSAEASGSFRETVDRSLAEAARSRRLLGSIGSDKSIQDIHLKSSLLTSADEATGRLRVVADALTATSLVATGRGQHWQEATSRLLTHVARMDEDVHLSLLEDAGDSSVGPDRSTFFHWPLEFPEVFERQAGGFDGFLANPPFVGAKPLSKAVGASTVTFWRQYWDVSGMVNLASLFLRRIAELMSDSGCFGLIMTDQVRVGASKEAGQVTGLEPGLAPEPEQVSQVTLEGTRICAVLPSWASRKDISRL